MSVCKNYHLIVTSLLRHHLQPRKIWDWITVFQLQVLLSPKATTMVPVSPDWWHTVIAQLIKSVGAEHDRHRHHFLHKSRDKCM